MHFIRLALLVVSLIGIQQAFAAESTSSEPFPQLCETYEPDCDRL